MNRAEAIIILATVISKAWIYGQSETGRRVAPSNTGIVSFVHNTLNSLPQLTVGVKRGFQPHATHNARGGSKGGKGAAPTKNSAPPVAPMKFMIKHNLPLVRGGSL